MGDLVLKTRVAVAKRNLRRIKNLPKTLEHRGKALEEFLELPGSLKAEVDSLLKVSDTLIGQARAFSEQDPRLLSRLKNLNSRLDKISRNLSRIGEAAERLKLEQSQFAKHRQDVEDFLAKRAQETENSLTESNYLKSRDEIEGYFSEYVDVLRAVALRSAGFRDEDSQLGDIFLIADQLPRLWGRIEGWEWRSFAVPSRSELNRKSQAFMLRIGFPEWTLWALPFVQNEFAHVFVARRSLGLVNPGSTSIESTMLADALATIVTGPAYACAALLLRLDPAAVTTADAEAAVRSATILVTLDQISKLANSSPLKTLADRLCMEWRDAVSVTGGNAEMFDLAMRDGFASDTAERAREAVLGRGQRGVPRRPSWAERWAIINDWAEHLRNERAKQIKPGDVGDNGENRPLALAFLLDAAWLARVGTTPDRDAPEDKLDVIADGAIRKMLEVVQGVADEPKSPANSQPGRRRNR